MSCNVKNCVDSALASLRLVGRLCGLSVKTSAEFDAAARALVALKQAVELTHQPVVIPPPKQTTLSPEAAPFVPLSVAASSNRTPCVNVDQETMTIGLDDDDVWSTSHAHSRHGDAVPISLALWLGIEDSAPKAEATNVDPDPAVQPNEDTVAKSHVYAVQAVLGSGETSTPLQCCPARDWEFKADDVVAEAISMYARRVTIRAVRSVWEHGNLNEVTKIDRDTRSIDVCTSTSQNCDIQVCEVKPVGKRNARGIMLDTATRLKRYAQRMRRRKENAVEYLLAQRSWHIKKYSLRTIWPCYGTVVYGQDVEVWLSKTKHAAKYAIPVHIGTSRLSELEQRQLLSFQKVMAVMGTFERRALCCKFGIAKWKKFEIWWKDMSELER